MYTAFGTVNILDCGTRANGDMLQAFPRYSLEELIRTAQAQLGDYTLSQEKRDAFGLSG